MAAAAAVFFSAGLARAETYHVAPGGDDGAAGSEAAPWETLQHAAETVVAGDTVIVHAGNYAGFALETSGSDGAPITFSGQPGAVIDSNNPVTIDGINVENVSYVIVEGFTITNTGRAGIRAATCDHVVIRNNRADQNARWGIFTAFCNDLVIEGNECSRSGAEHGIYTSNSGDRPVIRGNLVWGNNANGIHMNGDATEGGDGMISNALVEGNIIFGNGAAGGSAINCDGVTASVIQNNLIYGNLATGISLYTIDAASGSSGNLIASNTIVMPGGNNRWAILIRDGATGTTLRNNILWNGHSTRGAIDIAADSMSGLSSDFNAVVSRFTTDDGDSVLDLAQWQSATGQDGNSLVATPEQLFVDSAGDDYRLSATSPARDHGSADQVPDHDLAGNHRPVGDAYDIGALEYCEGEADCAAPPEGPPDGGPGPGGSDAGPGGPGPSDASPGGSNTPDDRLAGGCGCRTGGPGTGAIALTLLVAAALLSGRRTRR